LGEKGGWIMPSERETLIDVLKGQKDKKISLVELGRTLRKRQALGFGVEAIDVVDGLKAAGKVEFDSDQEIVTLKSP
jgi:hypothetical protein